MTNQADESGHVLTGTAAEKWYMRRRGAGHVLDAHYSVIRERFGPDVAYTARAPIDPLTERPAFLIIEITPPADQSDPWQSLEAVERDLLDRREALIEQSRRKDPFSNIIVTLRFGVEDWETVREEIERLD